MLMYDDTGEISTRKKTSQGFLVVTATLARTGIQSYRVGELNRNELPIKFKDADPNTVIRIRRPASVVLADEYVNEWNHQPTTLRHPSRDIDTINSSVLQKGFSLGNSRADKQTETVLNEIKLTDDTAIELSAEMKYVSGGYDSDVNWDDNGNGYDGTIENIKVNHIALCKNPRGGKAMRLHDSWKEKESKRMEITLKNVGVLSFNDEDKTSVDLFVKHYEEMSEKFDSLRGKSEAEKIKLQDEIKSLKSKIDDLNNPEKIQETINARVSLIDEAKKLHPELESDGKSDREIMIESITNHKEGMKFTDEDSDVFINGLFIGLTSSIDAEDKKKTKSTFRDSKRSKNKSTNPIAEARQRFIDRNNKKGDK